ncbi:MAG: hypothetical protein KDD70_02875 [Bdellovibrionales bacterium]|nr:hypothetical protein [Bdellovibrionales bacterium]
MSIDYLYDLERDVDNGREYYACPNVGRNQWVIAETLDELQRVAARTANHKKMPVNVVRLLSKHEAVGGDSYLVPTKIGEPGPRGEPTIEWSVVETKEASEMMRDVRHGPAPFFAMVVEHTVDPSEA